MVHLGIRRGIVRSISMALVLTSSSSWLLPVGAQSRPRVERLDSGTVIPVRLNNELSSKYSRRGDKFTATLRSETEQEGYGFPVGTKIEGVVRAARPRQDKDPGMLELDFRKVRLPDGRSYVIQGALIGLDNKSVSKGRDGRLIAKSQHRTDRLTYVGYGAGVGLIVGLLTKKPLEDAAVGAGLGYLYGALQKGDKNDARDVVLRIGTELGVRLDHSLSTAGYRRGGSNSAEEVDTVDISGSGPAGRLDRSRKGQGNQERDADLTDHSTGDITEEEIGVLVSDDNVRFDSTARPLIIRNVVMIPAIPVLKAAHVKTNYDSSRQSLTATTIEGNARISANSRVAVVKDKQTGSRRVRLETAAQLLNGTLYVPMRFLELATGNVVRWDASSRTVVMSGATQKEE